MPLTMHVVEAAVGAVLLYACGGRFVAPCYTSDHNVGSDNGDTGSVGPAEVELVVAPADILWHVVLPYCAGLATLALLVVVDNWDTIYSASAGAVHIRMPRQPLDEGAPWEEQVQPEADLEAGRHAKPRSTVISLFSVV